MEGASCAILQSQVDVFVYHRSWPVFENYFRGIYDVVLHEIWVCFLVLLLKIG